MIHAEDMLGKSKNSTLNSVELPQKIDLETLSPSSDPIELGWRISVGYFDDPECGGDILLRNLYAIRGGNLIMSSPSISGKGF